MTKKHVGQYRKRGKPNETQQECMARNTYCVGCPNVLESQACQTFKTPEVEYFMALDETDQALYLMTLDNDQ